MEIDLNKGLDNKVSEERFWNVYLKLLTINYPNLTDREIDVLALVLSEDIDRSVFRNGNHKRIAARLEMSLAQLSIMKRKLIEKGFLKYSEEEIVPHERLQMLRKYIRSEKSKGDFQIILKFPFVL